MLLVLVYIFSEVVGGGGELITSVDAVVGRGHLIEYNCDDWVLKYQRTWTVSEVKDFFFHQK